METSASDHKQQ